MPDACVGQIHVMENVSSTLQWIIFCVMKDYLYVESAAYLWSTIVSPHSLEGTCFSQMLLYSDKKWYVMKWDDAQNI